MTDRRITVQWTITTTETYQESFLIDKLPEGIRTAMLSQEGNLLHGLNLDDDAPSEFADILVMREAPVILQDATVHSRDIHLIEWSKS